MTRHRMNRRMGGSPARIKAYDRRISAIHESGHALMAIHLGYDATAWIHTNDTIAPLDEKTWLGHMSMHNTPTDSGHPHTRMVAVAGMVAETLWKNGHQEDYAEPYGWEDYLADEDSMSFSDWRLADCVPGEPDDNLYDVTADVGRLFMSDLWLTLTDMSRTLIGDTGNMRTFQSLRHASPLAA